ncbi:hypothetical protein [Oceanobacillus kapialis]|uniref:DUF7973 domain-containing protein n=1 Tax=Oceanobacillus kapialis TaxID=481353 RepID=A0ABW5PZZ2_9BACI
MSLLATLFAAFGGGVFGAVIGGTTAFIFTGFLGLTGIAIMLGGGSDIVLNEVAFGPFFGPHVAFVGAVAAAAFAGRKSKNNPKKRTRQATAKSEIASTAETDATDVQEVFHADGEAIKGEDVTMPLFKTKDPSVLLVGGVFGILGYLLNDLFASTWALPLDTIALVVLIFGFITRLVFGQSGLTGIFPQGEKRFNFTGKEILFHGIWGAGIAAVVAYVSILLDVNNLGFAISAASLIFLYFGLQFPASHHITMVAGYAALAFNSVWIAALFGLVVVIAGEYTQRAFNTHVDTHIDMPAINIAFFSFLILGILS